MKRALRWAGVVLLALLLVAAIVLVPRVVGMAEIGVGYVAKQVCSCIHVAGRDLAECLVDMPPAMAAIDASALSDREGIRASVLAGLVERTALRDPEGGCTLD